MDNRECDALLGAIHRLETRWHEGFSDEMYHSWDPLPFWLFFDGLRIADAHANGKRFLDVGCGIGTKLALAYHLGWSVAGIDRHGPYIESARELMPEADLVHADAFDVERFDADLVYMNRPAKSDELEDALEVHVRERLVTGTVLFLPDREHADACAGLTQLGPDVWQVP